jgi:hypothetical protein
MGFFATLARKSSMTDAGPVRDECVRDLPGNDRSGVPGRFEAVAEALAAGSETGNACAVVGRDTARDGADLGEALLGLQATYRHMLGTEPDFAAAQAVSTAWAEETLAYLHQLSCEDPLTGLASHAHARAKVTEVYRGAEQGGGSAQRSHALVVVDLPLLHPLLEQGLQDRLGEGMDPGEYRFNRALWLVKVGETVRLVFPGSETISRLGQSRLVVVTRREENLGRRVAALRDLVVDLGRFGHGARVWIEGLPPTDYSAAALLDELARD